MPSRPPHPCPAHGWVLVTDGAGCPLCAGQPALERPRPRDDRPSAAKRGYGTEHQRKREALLKRKPWCEDPYGLHSHKKVKSWIRDHRIPLALGGKDDETNEQALCVKCHNYKTARDGSRKDRGG